LSIDLEPPAASANDVHAAVRKSLDHLRDGGGAADVRHHLIGRREHSKLPAVVEAVRNHLLVSLFEDEQPNIRLRKQHQVQRK
jgi:hypothetical protein